MAGGLTLYKLIIVDDEAAIRNGIANSMPWKEIGFQVIGLCRNGQEALDLIEKNPPDVVLSDIRMPKMDGTELMQILSKNYPEIKIVILSGYNDFEYLNLSIKNKVAEYLLKPTDPEEIKKVFERISGELDVEREKNREIDILRQKYENDKKRHFKDVLDMCIKGYLDDAYFEDEFFAADFSPLENIATSYLFFLVPDGHLSDEPKELFNLNSKIVEKCKEILGSPVLGDFCISYEDTIVGVLTLGEKAGTSRAEKEIVTLAKIFQERVFSTLGTTISVGVSNQCKNVYDISQYYTQAKSCAMQSVFLGKETIFMYEQFTNSLHLPQVNMKMDLVLNSILAGDYDGYTGEVERVIEQFEGYPVKEYGYIDTICVAAMQSVGQMAIKQSVWPEEIMKSLGVSYTDVSRCANLEEKMMFVISVLFAFDKAMTQGKKQEGKSTIAASGIKYILDEKYRENAMSLEYVAEEMNRNPAYISRTFKTIYNMNFSEYLTKLRMEEGKRLLQETNQKIYEISKNIGYADASNFIKLFKKQYGISPNDFRVAKHGEKYEKKESV